MKTAGSIDCLPPSAAPWRAALWALVFAVLSATLLAYGQVELLIQWVSARLC